MGKKILAIVEVARGNEIVSREVLDVFAADHDIAAARAFNLELEERTAWRNGWQYEIAGTVRRVSFERCDADRIAETIAAVTL